MTAAPNFAYALLAKRLRRQAKPGDFDLSTLRFALSGAEPVEVADVGALVAWLVAEPERAPADFSVDGYLNTLHYLHMRGPAWGQPLVFTQSRHLLVAERPL